MLPVYNVNQIRNWDQFSIQNQSIQSIDLMESVAMKIVNWITKTYEPRRGFIIFAGNGNNGGDGLAVARILTLIGFEVHVVLIQVAGHVSGNFQINYERLVKIGFKNFLTTEAGFNFLEQVPACIIIDAVLGSGVDRPVSGELLLLVNRLNDIHNFKVSVDLPTGLDADKMTSSEFFHTDTTLTLQAPKLCQLIPDTGQYCGALTLLNIGLDPKYLDITPANKFFIEHSDVVSLYKPRSNFQYKNNFGHTLIIAGSEGMAGAALLSGEANLRTGSGLCTISSDPLNREIIQIGLPESIFENFNQIDYAKYSTIVIGPGLGITTKISKLFIEVLDHYKKPMLIDADALKIVHLENLISKIPAGSILTPHIGEFDYLFGKSENGFERLDKAIFEAEKNNIYIVLKGKYTAIVTPDKNVFFNSSGNVGLAKGGSGDVLSGMIGSLLAQSYTAKDACIVGVYLHGYAADLAAQNSAFESMMARDVIQKIPDAFLSLQR
ncbi:MAG: NAD(P)H-hydrate dehydratase [Saprospiraceae bacterium]|nr:NAD(P)H-hydrate dehydratase [Saprospiraceae bacterium]